LDEFCAVWLSRASRVASFAISRPRNWRTSAGVACQASSLSSAGRGGTSLVAVCPITQFLATRKIAHPPYLNGYALVYILSGLGALDTMTGRLTDARCQLCRAMTLATKICSPWLMLDILPWAAHVHAREGHTSAAYELAVMARQTPVMLSTSQPLLDRLCVELALALTVEEIAAATARGLARSAPEAVAELLAAWAPSPVHAATVDRPGAQGARRTVTAL